jgi:putative endonuclease
MVYLAQCCDGTLYAGITTNLAIRMAAHNSGKGASYTRGRTPVILVYAEGAATRSLALRREAEIKRLRRADKLRLLEGDSG